MPDWLSIQWKYPYPIHTRSVPKYFFQYPNPIRPEVENPYPLGPGHDDVNSGGGGGDNYDYDCNTYTQGHAPRVGHIPKYWRPTSDPHGLAKLTEKQGSLLCQERQGYIKVVCVFVFVFSLCLDSCLFMFLYLHLSRETRSHLIKSKWSKLGFFSPKNGVSLARHKNRTPLFNWYTPQNSHSVKLYLYRKHEHIFRSPFPIWMRDWTTRRWTNSCLTISRAEMFILMSWVSIST